MKSKLIAAAISGIVVGASGLAHAAPIREMNSLGPDIGVQPLDGKSGEKHTCRGQNACKGQGGCKTEKHACKGQNACRSQGGCKGG
jgi:hypothetical protein